MLLNIVVVIELIFRVEFLAGVLNSAVARVAGALNTNADSQYPEYSSATVSSDMHSKSNASGDQA